MIFIENNSNLLKRFPSIYSSNDSCFKTSILADNHFELTAKRQIKTNWTLGSNVIIIHSLVGI